MTGVSRWPIPTREYLLLLKYYWWLIVAVTSPGSTLADAWDSMMRLRRRKSFRRCLTEGSTLYVCDLNTLNAVSVGFDALLTIGSWNGVPPHGPRVVSRHLQRIPGQSRGK